MTEGGDTVTLEDVLRLVKQLSPVDKVRLIGRVAPEVERDLVARPNGSSRSLLGLLKGVGPAPSAEDVEAARREAWRGFPRDDI